MWCVLLADIALVVSAGSGTYGRVGLLDPGIFSYAGHTTNLGIIPNIPLFPLLELWALLSADLRLLMFVNLLLVC